MSRRCPQLAHTGRGAMLDLSPFWGPKRTWTSHYRRITIYEHAR
jgi:hypothetical protein